MSRCARSTSSRPGWSGSTHRCSITMPDRSAAGSIPGIGRQLGSEGLDSFRHTKLAMIDPGANAARFLVVSRTPMRRLFPESATPHPARRAAAAPGTRGAAYRRWTTAPRELGLRGVSWFWMVLFGVADPRALLLSSAGGRDAPARSAGRRKRLAAAASGTRPGAACGSPSTLATAAAATWCYMIGESVGGYLGFFQGGDGADRRLHGRHAAGAAGGRSRLRALRHRLDCLDQAAVRHRAAG